MLSNDFGTMNSTYISVTVFVFDVNISRLIHRYNLVRGHVVTTTSQVQGGSHITITQLQFKFDMDEPTGSTDDVFW